MIKTIVAVAALVLNFSTTAFSQDRDYGMSVCNQTAKEKIDIAIATARDNDWMVEGWWSATPGECRFVTNRDMVGNAFVYVKNQDGEAWESDWDLCIDMDDVFERPISDGTLADAFFETPSCPEGFTAKGFMRFDTTPDDYNVINIDGEPGFYPDLNTSMEMMFQ